MTDTMIEHDVVDLLIEQHMRIRNLFLEVEAASGDARHKAFQRLVRLLAVHETAEEQLVRPLTRLSVDGGNQIADDRLADDNHTGHGRYAAGQNGKTCGRGDQTRPQFLAVEQCQSPSCHRRFFGSTGSHPHISPAPPRRSTPRPPTLAGAALLGGPSRDARLPGAEPGTVAERFIWPDPAGRDGGPRRIDVVAAAARTSRLEVS